MSTAIGGWKSKPGGGMSPGPGGDRSTTYDIFVGNLPDQLDDAELQSLFVKYGEINSTTVLAGKRGDGKRIAFVRFVNESDAIAACQDSTGLILNGNPITVRRASKRLGGSQSGGGATGGGDGTGRKTDRRQPTGGHGCGPLDQSGSLDKPEPGFNHKPRGGAGSLPHAPSVAVPLKEDKVMVTHIESPTCFWAQVVGNQVELLQIVENLGAVCPSATALAGQPLMEKVYATKFSEDEDWYRCRLVKYVSDSKSEVQYIDYGNGEVVQNGTIVELPPSVANIRPQASKYVLYGLKPYSYDSQSVGHEQGVKTLGELTNGKLLSGKIYFGPKMGPIPVILEDGDVDINQEMLNAGFGEKRFTAHSPHGPGKPGSYPGGDRQSKWTNEPSRRSPPAQSGMETFSRMGTFNEMDVASSSAKFRSTPPPNWGEVKQLPQDVGQLQSELQKTRHQLYDLQALTRDSQVTAADLILLQREKNSFIMELATTRGKLRTLEDDYSEMSVKLQEASLHYKMVNLLAGVNKVKELRKQFPTDSQTPDNIQRAIDLVSNASDRISIPSLSIITELETVMACYNTAQDDIRACTDLESLPALIATRDEQRVELYDKIVHFLEGIQSLPLETRATQLKDTVAFLEMTHGCFLKAEITNPLGLEDALEAYHEWKMKKELEFQDVRTDTNTRHNAVISALRTVQHQLSLEVVNTPESPPAATANLDQLLAKLQAAMMKEVEKTDIQRDSECGFIAIVLKTLVTQVKCELKDITQLEALRLEYLGLQMQLGHWLTDCPSVADLKAARQTIKALKSRLRHTLADKQDAEESDDSRSEELATINSELTEIRRQLQAAFAQESELLSEIAELNERHFPELALQYPEFNIDNEVKYGGLLKLSHTLEQYDVGPLPSCSKKSIMKSTHCGKPVIIKEYIIDDGGGQKMGEFMRRALAYNSVVNEHLVPLQDIFFGKNERHAYVRLPYYTNSLTSLVEERHRLTDTEIYRVLVGVLKGLRALHEMRLIHGVLHPNNVFLDDNNNTCIADFDFTKTLKQRAERVFTTSTGLVFSAPEGASNSSHCSDMFNFGLLMLWLNFPEVHFNVSNKGIPDISCVGMSEELSTIIYNLRSENPVQRFTAFDLLNDPYFMTPPETLPRPVANPEDDVIQLRPRTVSPTDRDRSVPGGILKNGTAAVCTEGNDPSEQTDSQDKAETTPLDGATGDDTPVEPVTENSTDDVQNSDSVSDQPRTDGLQLDIPVISVQPPTPTPLSPGHQPGVDTDAVSPDSLPDLDEILGVPVNGDASSDMDDDTAVDAMQVTLSCHTTSTDDTVESGDTAEACQVAQKLIQTYEELPIDP